MKSWRFSGGLDPGNTRKNKIKDDPPFLTWGRVNNELIWGRVWTLDRWAAAAKLLQLCPTLCDPTDSSPLGSPVPGILQARTLEWVAISFSKSWKWKVKLKSLSRVWLFETPWTAAYQAPPPMGFSRQKYWSGLPLPSPTTTTLRPKVFFFQFIF